MPIHRNGNWPHRRVWSNAEWLLLASLCSHMLAHYIGFNEPWYIPIYYIRWEYGKFICLKVTSSNPFEKEAQNEASKSPIFENERKSIKNRIYFRFALLPFRERAGNVASVSLFAVTLDTKIRSIFFGRDGFVSCDILECQDRVKFWWAEMWRSDKFGDAWDRCYKTFFSSYTFNM